MNTNFLKRMFFIFFITGIMVLPTYGDVFASTNQTQETPKETDKQQSTKDEINRKRNELRGLFETKKNELRGRAQRAVGEENKQKILRAVDSLNEINERRTNQFLNLIGKIDSALQRALTRIGEVERRGINVSEIRIKAEEANRIIGEARSLALSQADKLYNIEGTTRKELLTAMKTARNNLRKDMESIRTKVKEARTAVVEVIKAINNANQ